MVICSSIPDSYGQRTRAKMVPRPHSVTNYKTTNLIPSNTPSTTSSKGFRLTEQQDDTGSVYSLYKQKIDSMFTDPTNKYQETLNNSVQARIEKMFTDITEDQPYVVDGVVIPSHSFTVDYLGSTPLEQKVTSLLGLQKPLKELYFAYRKNLRHKKIFTGRLEISHEGLKVQYQGDKGDLEQLNTFPTIAVWSAVKFVVTENLQKYAFLPLITDPDNINKNTLFQIFNSNEQKYIANVTHSPIFAVVMRKFGAAKQLECHAFVCRTSEDAIVIAATLYKSLMAFMSKKNKTPQIPKNRNGISCISIASTDKKSYEARIPVRPPRRKRSTTSSVTSTDSQRMKNQPKRSGKPIEDLDAIIPYEATQAKTDLIRDFNNGQRNAHDCLTTSGSTVAEFQRAQSIRKSNQEKTGILPPNSTESGDILTKVTIPRSGSFLNAKGLTKYKSTTNRGHGPGNGGSPLGFHELFNEFRIQEGLNSLDEILSAIIDFEGMSFNDLKPIYKEFLLKLALTLTKDELYQKSKYIMRRQKKKLMRRNSANQNKRKKMILGAKGLKKVFRRPFKVRFAQKFRSSKKTKVNYTTAKKANSIDSSLSSSCDTHQFRPKEAPKECTERQSKNNTAATTSEESDFFSLQRNRRKCNNQTCHNTQNRNSSSGYVSCSECSYDSDSCTCVSADKCYCSLGQKNSLGGCVKESLSSCKTDDKCYCSLKKADIIENTIYQSLNQPLIQGTHLNCKQIHKYYNDLARLQHETRHKSDSLSWCGCDTDSCTDSNKCYCQTDGIPLIRKRTMVDQLKQRGFTTGLNQPQIPPPQRKPQQRFSKSTKSSKSLEYLHNPEEHPIYYEKIQESRRRNFSVDNLALDYELFTVSKSNPQGRANSESGGLKSVFKASDSLRSFNNEREGSTPRSGGNHEALSVKKSAEIAALFADVKLSQTTDITHLINSDSSDGGRKHLPKQLNSLNERITSHLQYQRNALLEQQKKNYREIFSTPVESGSNNRNRNGNRNSFINRKPIKNHLYSAKNGLYTIQSQSDDSRNSSANEKQATVKGKTEMPLQKSMSSHLEDSLGYLP